MSRYAASTDVPSDRSRAEIERTLIRYGASGFAYGWQDQQAIVGFTHNGWQIRFYLPLPDRNSREFTHTPSRGYARTPAQQEQAYDQAVKQRWRALALVIKAKLEAVEAGIVTFEEEFGMHTILPDGQRVADHVLPGIREAYVTGRVQPLLQIEGA